MEWTHFIGHGVIFLSAALIIVSSVAFKVLHRRRARRAPLQGRKVENLPGQQVLERITHHDHQLDTAVSLMYMALPLMFLVWMTPRVDWTQLQFGTREAIFATGVAAMFGWGLRDFVRHYRAREKMRDGWTAEYVTGQQLNRLVAQGCLVLHDLPAEYGNIDHVVIAPRGVYAVETKSFRKPRTAGQKRDDPGHQVRYDGRGLVFPDFATREPVEQAARQAQWLRRTLRAELGQELPVIPAVALPGWYVVRSEEGKRADVQVFTPMGKGAEFMAWEPERLTQDMRRRIANALALRYPEIDA